MPASLCGSSHRSGYAPPTRLRWVCGSLKARALTHCKAARPFLPRTASAPIVLCSAPFSTPPPYFGLLLGGPLHWSNSYNGSVGNIRLLQNPMSLDQRHTKLNKVKSTRRIIKEINIFYIIFSKLFKAQKTFINSRMFHNIKLCIFILKILLKTIRRSRQSEKEVLSAQEKLYSAVIYKD